MGCGMSSQPGQRSFLYYDKLPSDKAPTGKTTCLLLIDPQNDFVLETGTLSVPGAVEDCDRIRAALKENISKVDDIFVTLDTHEKYHIAHAIFWKNDKGERPQPFSAITVKDVEKRVWITNNPAHQTWAEKYVKALEAGGRFKLTIWPEHCLIGSQGHAVYAPLLDVIHEWEAEHLRTTNFVMKGNNAFTEHYSAVKAEVLMAEDPHTNLNTVLLDSLLKHDRVIIAGQALSHCVNFTVRDIVANIPASALSKLYVITDGCSSVRGFEAAGQQFLDDMKTRGIKFVTAAQAFQ